MQNESDDDTPAELSKSERKRQVLALQKLGEALVNLSEKEFQQIPLEPVLLEAIQHARGLTSHEAKRRQLQYIGKLMRHVDAEPIQKALDTLQNKNQENKLQFHRVERWRDKLIAEGDAALQTLMDEYPSLDRQQLRQIIRNAQQNKPGAATELFRLLRELLT